MAADRRRTVFDLFLAPAIAQARRINLRQNRPTSEGAEFLAASAGRTERADFRPARRLHPSRKLQRHGVKKIVPENKNETFGLFVRNQQVERIIRRELKKLNGDDNAKPRFNLSAQVRRYPVEESIGAVG